MQRYQHINPAWFHAYQPEPLPQSTASPTNRASVMETMSWKPFRRYRAASALTQTLIHYNERQATMTVTTTVKGYFHITVDSLDVAQTFIDIVNELYPEKCTEWLVQIGPDITLSGVPGPDDKMCYGIPFQAKGRNDYRKNLTMLDVIGSKTSAKKIQRLHVTKRLTIVASWEEFATEESFIARGQAIIEKNKGMALTLRF